MAPKVFKMVSADELRQERQAGTALFPPLAPTEPEPEPEPKPKPEPSAGTGEDDEHVQQLENELESMRRMLTELRLRELGAHRQQRQQHLQLQQQRRRHQQPQLQPPQPQPQQVGGEQLRASPSTLFAQELERMESGGYVVSRSHLDSPVKSNAIGGKKAPGAEGGRGRRRQPRTKGATPQAGFLVNAARVKRELLNLKAGLASVRAGGTAMDSTLGATQMASALAAISAAEAEAERKEPRAQPKALEVQPIMRSKPEPEPEPELEPERARVLYHELGHEPEEPRIVLPQIGAGAPKDLQQSHGGPSSHMHTHLAGKRGRRGRRREATKREATDHMTPSASLAPVVHTTSDTSSLPAVQPRTRTRTRTRTRHRQAKISPVFSPSPDPIGSMATMPTMRAQSPPPIEAGRGLSVERQLGCFLVPAGKPVRRRHRKARGPVLT